MPFHMLCIYMKRINTKHITIVSNLKNGPCGKEKNVKGNKAIITYCTFVVVIS